MEKKTNKQLMMLLFMALVLACSSSEPSSDPPPQEPLRAEDDELVVDENSGPGPDNEIDVSENDTFGVNGPASNAFVVTQPTEFGALSELEDGLYEYIPNQGYFGQDSFTYQISDANGNTDTAVVNITVNEVEPPSEAFDNIDPNFPSFTSIEDTTPEGKVWVKHDAMSDEFEAWDPGKWFKSTWNYGVPVLMSTSADNSGVDNGHLWIKATLNENNPEGRWFQTARIHSREETKYPMYTEARIKTAHISAYNTYWLNNGDINDRDEIDIIENNSKPSCIGCDAEIFPQQMNSQYFQADSNETPQTIRNYGNYLRSDLSDNNPLKNSGWNEEYHTYGVWWKDSKNIQFYLDGEPAGSVTVGEDRSGSVYPDREFTRELEIIFDLWTNEAGWLGGLPEQSELSNDAINTMRVDWVRTWKLEDE